MNSQDEAAWLLLSPAPCLYVGSTTKKHRPSLLRRHRRVHRRVVLPGRGGADRPPWIWFFGPDGNLVCRQSARHNGQWQRVALRRAHRSVFLDPFVPTRHWPGIISGPPGALPVSRRKIAVCHRPAGESGSKAEKDNLIG